MMQQELVLMEGGETPGSVEEMEILKMTQPVSATALW